MTPPRDTPYPIDYYPIVNFGVYGRSYFNILQHTVTWVPLLGSSNLVIISLRPTVR